jgi:hypothetical protein
VPARVQPTDQIAGITDSVGGLRVVAVRLWVSPALQLGPKQRGREDEVAADGGDVTLVTRQSGQSSRAPARP